MKILALVSAAIGGGFGSRNPFGLAYPARDPEGGDADLGGGGGDGGGEALEIDGDHDGAGASIVPDGINNNRDRAAAQARGNTSSGEPALHVAASGVMVDEEDPDLNPEGGEDPNADPNADGQPDPNAQPQLTESQRVTQFFGQQIQELTQRQEQERHQYRQDMQQVVAQNHQLQQTIASFVQAGQQRMVEQQRARAMPQRPPDDAPEADKIRWEMAMEQHRHNEASGGLMNEVRALKESIRQSEINREKQAQEFKLNQQREAWTAKYDANMAKVRSAQQYDFLRDNSYTDPQTGQKVSRGEVYFNVLYNEFCRRTGDVVDVAELANDFGQYIDACVKQRMSRGTSPQVRQQVNANARHEQQNRPGAKVVPMGGNQRKAPQSQPGRTRGPSGRVDVTMAEHMKTRGKFFNAPGERFAIGGDV